jgi:hypothetical protein
MGEQAARSIRGVLENRQTAYGDVDAGANNEDQADAHGAGPGEHL